MPPTPTSTTMKSTPPNMSSSSPSYYSAPSPYLYPPISSPRKIEFATSVSTFALQLNNQTVLESHPHDVKSRCCHRKHSASSYNFATNPFTLHDSHLDQLLSSLAPTKESSHDNPNITNQRTSDCRQYSSVRRRRKSLALMMGNIGRNAISLRGY